MLNTHRLHRRAALCKSRGGFTLVELLVVIGIIAILAGVALGPITNGIKKAHQSAGMQEAHALGLALLSFANDNNSTYPDTSNPTGNTGTGAAAATQPLIAGGYVTDPSIFFISGGTAVQYTGTTAAAATTITANNVSWDFTGNGGTGITQSYPDEGPLMWSTVTGGTAPNVGGLTGTGAIAITAIPNSKNPFGTAGMAVYFKNGSSKFVVSSLVAGVLTSTIVSAANNPGGGPTTAIVLAGGG